MLRAWRSRLLYMPSISLFIVLVTVHVSVPYSKLLSTVQRNKLLFNLRGKSDFHMLSSFRIAAQVWAFLVFISLSEFPTQEPQSLESFTFLSGFSLARIVSFLGFGVLYSVSSSFMLRPTSLVVLMTCGEC